MLRYLLPHLTPLLLIAAIYAAMAAVQFSIATRLRWRVRQFRRRISAA